MGKITVDITMSLDGYIAGLHETLEHGLGINGERLHQWMYDLSSWRERHGLEGGTADPASDILEDAFKDVGAILMGRHMFDLVPDAWGDDPPFHMPVFVLTHRAHEPLVKQGGTTFYFVTDGIESALRQAQAASAGGNVALGGGADLIQQFLKAGWIDEMQIHIAHVLLGQGRRLFDQLPPEHIELELLRSLDTPGVTHLQFRVVK